VAHYRDFRGPTRLERFQGDYFEVWIEVTREKEKARLQHAHEDEPLVFEGFGAADDAAMAQWLEWVEDILADELEKPEERI
jgi:hypothetical protein